jgi:hypothetical protein
MNQTDTEKRDSLAREAMRYFIDAKVFDFTTYAMDPLRLAWWSYELADAMMIASKTPPKILEDFSETMTVKHMEQLKKIRKEMSRAR